MACSVQVLTVVAFTDAAGGIETIVIQGVATPAECGRLEVRIDCAAVSKMDTVPVRADGTWMATFDLQGKCLCEGTMVTVTATCSIDPSCSIVWSGKAECRQPNQCPIAFTYVNSIDPNAACDNGTRQVSGVLLVTPSPALPVGIVGITLDGVAIPNTSHAPSPTGFPVPFSTTWTGGTMPVLRWTFTNPACPPGYDGVVVPPCDGSDGGGSDGDDNGSGGGGGWGWPSCFALRVAVVALFAGAVLLGLIAICSGGAALAIAAAALAALGAIAFAFWYYFCGSRCDVYLILWQIAYVSAWFAVYMITCCTPALIAFLILLAVTLVFFGLWVSRCARGRCEIIGELLWTTGTPLPIVLWVVQHILPCGAQTAIEHAHEVMTALLALVAAPCLIQASQMMRGASKR